MTSAVQVLAARPRHNSAVSVLVEEINVLRNERTVLATALRELVAGAAAMDKRLLTLTGSKFECERGDITRAHAALVLVRP